MNDKEAIRFAGLMEDYLNIPSFVCEAIEKDLCNGKYKETIEYVINRRNEIENKEDYISEQQLIDKCIDLQSNWNRLREELYQANRELVTNELVNGKELINNIIDIMNELESGVIE